MFSRRIPAPYVPLVERAITNALLGVPEGEDFEVCIVSLSHVGEADETPTIRLEVFDE